jgi:hypothetical protein
MKPITDVLREIRKGRVVDHASEVLAEVVQAVDATKKAGSITIKLTITPEKGGGSQKTISAKVTSSKPEEDLPDAIFFSDEEGDLHRNDPEQGEMFRDAERGDKLDAGPRTQARA